MASYPEFYQRSLQPEPFWSEQAELIHWHKPFAQVLDYAKPPFAWWFVGGETNLCYNAVDRHLAERGEQKAIIYISTETGQERVYTYRELHDEVNRVAAMLQGLGVGQGRPRPHLHADDPRGGLRDARVGAHRRDPLGRVRRLRGALAGHAHRRRPAQGHDDRRRRHARRQGRALQAARRRVAAPVRQPAAARGHQGPRPRPGLRAHARPRPRLRRAAYAPPRHPGPGDLGRVDAPVVHPLHLGHDREAQGRAARHRRLRGRAGRVDAPHLRRAPGRDLLLDLGHRLGRRPLVHRLRPAAERHGHRGLRGHADPSGSGHLVEDRAGPPRERHVHRADGAARAEEAGPGVPRQVRPRVAAPPVPRRRAARRADGALDRRGAGQADLRPLLADRDRLGHPRAGARGRAAAGQVRQPELRGLRLRRPAPPRSHRRGGRAQREGRGVHRAAAAAPDACRRCGARTTASSTPTSRASAIG